MVGPDHVVVEDVLEVRRYDRSRRRARRPPYRADATGSKSSRCVTEMRLPEPPAVLVTMIRLAVRTAPVLREDVRHLRGRRRRHGRRILWTGVDESEVRLRARINRRGAIPTGL